MQHQSRFHSVLVLGVVQVLEFRACLGFKFMVYCKNSGWDLLAMYWHRGADIDALIFKPVHVIPTYASLLSPASMPFFMFLSMWFSTDPMTSTGASIKKPFPIS